VSKKIAIGPALLFTAIAKILVTYLQDRLSLEMVASMKKNATFQP
jgi:hypothetical protein